MNMCGRTVIVDDVEVIVKRFNLDTQVDIQFEPNYNVAIGAYNPVVTQEEPKKLQMFQFGLTPSWAKKPSYFFNARCEGDQNQDDDPGFTSDNFGILSKPAFRKPIRSQRCLVIVSAFIEGSKAEGLSKPFLVYLREKQRPFALAGIYDFWKNPTTGEVLKSYSIITTTANALLQKIGHHRMPVIITPGREQEWLKPDTDINSIGRFFGSFNPEKMNAYPISPAIKSPKAKGRELIDPIGQTIYPEVEEIKVTGTVKTFGMGNNKKEEPVKVSEPKYVVFDHPIRGFFIVPEEKAMNFNGLPRVSSAVENEITESFSFNRRWVVRNAELESAFSENFQFRRYKEEEEDEIVWVVELKQDRSLHVEYE